MINLVVVAALMWLINDHNHVTFAMRGLDLVLKSDPETPRAILVGDKVLPAEDMDNSQFTFCFYIHVKRAESMRTITPVSYSSRENGVDNEFCLDFNHKWNYTTLTVNKLGCPFFGFIPKADKWTHVCVVWMNDYGQVDYYFDGEWVESNFGLKIDHRIGGNGYLVLGQDQDGYDTGYEAEDGVTGRMTQFHYWDWALNDDEVNAVRRCEMEGNIINWNNSTWSLDDKIKIEVTTAPCGSLCPDAKAYAEQKNL